jgi:uncharacterized integral membrane protein
MSTVKWILIVLFFLVVLLFAIQNPQKVPSVGFMHWVWLNVSVFWIAYAAFVAGIIMTLLLFGLNLLRMRSRVHKLLKENKKIMEELSRMRNASIDEDFDSSEPEDERKMQPRKKR